MRRVSVTQSVLSLVAIALCAPAAVQAQRGLSRLPGFGGLGGGRTPAAEESPALPGGGDPQAMMAAFEQAQANAAQPGDENLDCEQLQQQFIALMNDEAVQQYVDSIVPPEDDPNAQAAQQAAEAAAAKPHFGIGRMFAAMAMSMVPGGGMAQMGMSMGMAANARQQQAKRLEEIAQQMEQMTKVMPQMMRGQRLGQLAMEKQCDWAAGAMAGAGAPPQ